VAVFSGWAEAPGCDFAPKVHALPRGVCRRVCNALCPRTARRRLEMRADGRKPPAAIRTEGARAAEGRLRSRWQGRLPADCRPAADDASGWAEAPGCDFAPKVRALARAVCGRVYRALCPRTAVRRLEMRADGRKPNRVDFLAEAASGSPLPRLGRGGIEAALRPDWENFKVIRRLQLRWQGSLPADCRPAAQGLWQQTQIREQVIDQ
jgi:hypothetical protein